ARDLTPGVLDPVGDRRPAVIQALPDDVDLVAAARAVLHFPQLARVRMQRRRLHVAMADRPDLRSRAFLSDERVVLRDAPVRIDPGDLADQAVHLLRLHAPWR